MMRNLKLVLLAAALPILGVAGAPAYAQSVYVDVPPAATYYDDDGPEYDTRTRVYAYERRVYRPGAYVETGPRVYGWSYAPNETVVTRVLPGNCGQYRYWRNGRCVDARD